MKSKSTEEIGGAKCCVNLIQITLMITRAVGDRFGVGGIADRYIRLNGYPFLDKEDHAFGVPGKIVGLIKLSAYACLLRLLPVSHVMQTDMTVLTASGVPFREIGTHGKYWYRGFLTHDFSSQRRYCKPPCSKGSL